MAYLQFRLPLAVGLSIFVGLLMYLLAYPSPASMAIAQGMRMLVLLVFPIVAFVGKGRLKAFAIGACLWSWMLTGLLDLGIRGEPFDSCFKLMGHLMRFLEEFYSNTAYPNVHGHEILTCALAMLMGLLGGGLAVLVARMSDDKKEAPSHAS